VLVSVIDVGSNTVRLLVADVGRGEAPSPVVTDKAYLGLGAEIARSGSLSPETVEAAAHVCGRFAGRARRAGAENALVIVTAPGRQGRDPDALVSALRARTRLPVRVLTAEDEGWLAYEGALARAVEPLPDSVGVVDVGGGSTEVVVGNRATGALWVDSVDLGSLRLTRLALEGDPPSKRELAEARDLVRRALAPLSPQPPEAALAVGGSARALAKLVGRTFDADDADAAIEILARRRSSKVARGAGIDERRAGTVLAGALLLAETSRLLGRPFTLARGGLREGVALGLAREDGRSAAAA
jgi:exopolyphosphatase / guanosine-5'-triphosphate,3'-diphosphate pyrophosphatase